MPVDLFALEDGMEDLKQNPSDSSRSYGGSAMHRYRFAIMGGVGISFLLVVAIALSAASLQRSNDALALVLAASEKEAQEAAIEAKAKANAIPDVPHAEVHESLADFEAWEESAPVTVAVAVVATTPSPTNEPTPGPTDGPTDAPTKTHPLNPKWFHTDHEDYQSFSDNALNAELHPWLIASMFCHKQSLEPCDYDVLCPKGKGRNPFHGGPPKNYGWKDREPEQWSPLYSPEEQGDGFGWIQVGSISDEDGATNGNKCWNWDDWRGGKIMDILTEEHRQWILCCEKGEFFD